MKLIIPKSLSSLLDSIKANLAIANRYGFTTDSLQFELSDVSEIQIASDQQSWVFTTDLFISSQTPNKLNHESPLDYSSQLEINYDHHYQVTDIVQQRKINQVLVGVRDQNTFLDVWSFSTLSESKLKVSNSESATVNDSALKALYIPNSMQQQLQPEQHFAWLITLLLIDFPLEDSLVLARAMSNVSHETWPVDVDLFPIPVLEDPRLNIQVGWSRNSQVLCFPTIKESLGLYPVVAEVSLIEKLLKQGVTTVQLRIKDPEQPDLEAQIIRAIQLGQQYQAKVFINDYWQLAIKHGAYGVHLGQEDIELSNLNQLHNAGIRLGLSTHGYYELLRIAQINPSYIALGHIFPTTTKQMPSKPQGLIRLALYQQLINSLPYGCRVHDDNAQQSKGVPTVAIGGIDQSNAQQVWACGVSSLAVVRAITLAPDIAPVLNTFQQIMQYPAAEFNPKNFMAKTNLVNRGVVNAK